MYLIDSQVEQYMLENYETSDYNDLTDEEKIDVDEMRETYTRRYYETLQDYEPAD